MVPRGDKAWNGGPLKVNSRLYYYCSNNNREEKKDEGREKIDFFSASRELVFMTVRWQGYGILTARWLCRNPKNSYLLKIYKEERKCVKRNFGLVNRSFLPFLKVLLFFPSIV